MKSKASLLCHIIDYETLNKLILSKFLLALIKFQHGIEANCYMLSQVISRYFSKANCKECITINGI